MNISIVEPSFPLPSERAHSLSMTIKSFKGRRDVQVHLFRTNWTESDEASQDWDTLIASSTAPSTQDSSGSKRIIMEAFTTKERDSIINYLKRQYSTRLTALDSVPLSFPVPAGLTGLTQIEAGKDIGFIEFNKIPAYSLDISMKGLYDLSQHPPIVEE